MQKSVAKTVAKLQLPAFKSATHLLALNIKQADSKTKISLPTVTHLKMVSLHVDISKKHMFVHLWINDAASSQHDLT